MWRASRAIAVAQCAAAFAVACSSQVDSPSDGAPGQASVDARVGDSPADGVDADPVGGQPVVDGAALATQDASAATQDAGDRVLIDPEDVMDAGMTAPDSSTAPAPVYFRITELWLRDPRFFLGTTDITDTPFLGQSVNGSLIPGGLTMDYDGDTYADVSILVELAVADPSAASTTLGLMDAHCVLPELTGCIEHPSPGLDATFTAINQAADNCLGPVETSASSFDAAGGELPAGPCFATQEERDVVMDLGGIRLELTTTRVAASYEGTGPDKLVRGLIRGFLTESVAQRVLLPDYLPLLANTPLSDYLQAEEKDLDQSPTGDDGWWVYLNFVAEPVKFRTLEELSQ